MEYQLFPIKTCVEIFSEKIRKFNNVGVFK